MTRVSIIKVEEHQDLYHAVDSAINLIGTFDFKDKKILLKPNCLMDSRNAITNPILLGNIAKLVRKKGGYPIIGDSPMSGGKTAQEIYSKVKYKNKSGFEIINEIENECEWISF